VTTAILVLPQGKRKSYSAGLIPFLPYSSLKKGTI